MLTIADAAKLSGLPAPYLRRLLRDGRLAFMAPVPRKGCASRASLIDAWRLRCVLVLLEAGLDEIDALWVLDTELDTRVGALFGPAIPVPEAFVANRLDGAAVHVARDTDGMPEIDCTPSNVPALDDVEASVTLNLMPIWAGVIARYETRAVGGRSNSPALAHRGAMCADGVAPIPSTYAGHPANGEPA